MLVSRARSVLLGVIVALAVVLSGSIAQVAKADTPPGTGGLFVATAGRLASTATGVGTTQAPLTANSPRVLTPVGQFGVPTTGVSAVMITFTVTGATSSGNFSASAVGTSLFGVMKYDASGGGVTTNSAVVPLSTDGKFQFQASSSVNVNIDIQGYFTTGNGVAAPGGYQSVPASRIVNTVAGVGANQSPLAAASTTNIQVTGRGGVPAGASAVFVNFQINNSNTASGYINPYATSPTSRPGVALNFPGDPYTSIGAIVPLDSSGKFQLYLSAGNTINLMVDVQGYFVAGSPYGFNAATGVLLDTRSATSIAPNDTIVLPVGGASGLPTTAGGLSAAALYFVVFGKGNAGGYVRAWADGSAEPLGTSTLTFGSGVGVQTSNLATIPVGTTNAIRVHNVSSDPIDLVVQAQGYYATDLPIVACASPFQANSWTTQIPSDPINCTVSMSGRGGGDLSLSVDDLNPLAIPTNGATVSTPVTIDPSPGGHVIIAQRTNGGVPAGSPVQYSFSLGDWARAPLTGVPADQTVTATLTPTLSINSLGDAISPDAVVRYTITANPDGVTAPLERSDWRTTPFTVTSGLLSEGSTYYWTAEVSGKSGGNSIVETIRSSVYALVASTSGPTNPSDAYMQFPLSEPTVEEVQQADQQPTDLNVYGAPTSAGAPAGSGPVFLSGSHWSIQCSGVIQYPHISSTLLKYYKVRSVDNKIDMRCTGVGRATIEIVVRGSMLFAPANSPSDVNNRKFQARAYMDERNTMVVGGAKRTFVVPNTGKAGAGLGKGFWYTYFSYQALVDGKYYGSVGSQSQILFLDLR